MLVKISKASDWADEKPIPGTELMTINHGTYKEKIRVLNIKPEEILNLLDEYNEELILRKVLKNYPGIDYEIIIYDDYIE